MLRKAHNIEAEILRLLAERAPGRSICPSEAARSVAGSEERRCWQPLMEPVREAAARLVRDGVLIVTQRGETVDIEGAKGPVRLRLREKR